MTVEEAKKELVVQLNQASMNTLVNDLAIALVKNGEQAKEIEALKAEVESLKIYPGQNVRVPEATMEAQQQR